MYRRYSDSSIVQPCLLEKDRNKCVFFTNIIIVQCIVVFAASASILQCVWSPEHAQSDFNKLARIMYLYDSHACGFHLRRAKAVINLQFSNATYGYSVLPIKWKPALSTVSTRLTAKTRKYVELSVAIHAVWMVLAIAFRIVINSSTDMKIIKFALNVFFYACICVIIFDLSMALVYVSHIKQSLTKGMVLRYSGWSVNINLKSYEEFAGWLPIVASIYWLKCVVIFALNLYSCKVFQFTKKNIRRRELKKKILREGNQPIPEHVPIFPEGRVLVYRNGERKPYVAKNYPFYHN